MTKIKFFKKNENIVGFECLGHTGYADENDVLCATISGIVQGGILGILKVLKINAKLSRDDDRGYIRIELPECISDDNLKSSQIIFLTIKESIEDLIQGYSQYISMEVIENVY